MLHLRKPKGCFEPAELMGLPAPASDTAATAAAKGGDAPSVCLWMALISSREGPTTYFCGLEVLSTSLRTVVKRQRSPNVVIMSMLKAAYGMGQQNSEDPASMGALQYVAVLSQQTGQDLRTRRALGRKCELRASPGVQRK